MLREIFQPSKSDFQRALKQANRAMQEREAEAKARQFGMAYVNLNGFPVDLAILGLWPLKEAQVLGCVAIHLEGKDLKIAVTKPDNPLYLEKKAELEKHYQVTEYYISAQSLADAFEMYSKVAAPTNLHTDVVEVKEEKDYLKEFDLLADYELQKNLNASAWVNMIFGAAMYFSASDIHLEPEKDFYKLRLRVDGMLHDFLHLSKDLQKAITSRIKILSKLKINVENEPQDGRMSFVYFEKTIDVRVSSLPSVYGESFVMRLLGTGATTLKFADLGFVGLSRTVVEDALSRPNGMIITTGATGSGKTTTLYAFVNELNTQDKKIITLEDPVEYKLEGVEQVQIDHRTSLGFAEGLRSILRQDPDIVLVGEIRDQETADTALQAALTGHVVLSTLHTNDASGAVPRLLSMGVQPFVIAPGLTCVIAQRLVRKLCENCKVVTPLEPSILEKVTTEVKAIPPIAGITLPNSWIFYSAPGCPLCKGLGYKGRIGVFEVFAVTPEMQQSILKSLSAVELHEIAKSHGMISMLQDGLVKALSGMTDVAEVYRVAS